MGSSYTIKDQHAIYFVTFTIVDWIDVFTRKIYKDICIESLAFCRKNKGLKIYGYVIMSNHLHLILQSDTLPLSDIIRDPIAIGFKKFTANRIIDYIQDGFNESRKEWILNRFQFNASKHQRNSKYQVWTHENHAEELLSTKFIQQKLDYMHQNPPGKMTTTNNTFIETNDEMIIGGSYQKVKVDKHKGDGDFPDATEANHGGYDGNLIFGKTWIEYMSGRQDVLTVKVSSLNLSRVSQSDISKDGYVNLANPSVFGLFAFTGTALALGSIKVIPQGKNMFRIADDIYDFDIRENEGLSFRNIATGFGGILHGGVYDNYSLLFPIYEPGFKIHFEGSIYIKP